MRPKGLLFASFLNLSLACFLLIFGSPKRSKMEPKSLKIALGGSSFFDLRFSGVFLLFFVDFVWFWQGAKCLAHRQGRCKTHFRQKWHFPSPDLIFDKIFVILSDLFFPETVKNRSQTGLETITFLGLPFFSGFLWFWVPFGRTRPPNRRGAFLHHF